MQIINSPKRFASMQSNALFEVRPESAEPTEIKILDSEGSPVGVKKFAACDSFKVNVAPYWGHLLQVEPCGVESPNVFLNNDRVVTAKISAESGAQSLESQAVPLLYAKFDSEVGALLNKIPEPKIIYRNGCEQIDLLVDGQSVSAEIEVMTGGSTTASYEWGALPVASGVVLVVVNARKIIQMVGCETATMTFRLKISVGDAVRYVEYLLLNDADERVSLKWLNAFGAVESHPFDSVCAEVRSADERCTTLSLTSEPEDGVVVKWLSEIISAEQVWLVKDGRVVVVEVATDKVEIKTAQIQRIVINVTLPESLTTI